MNEFKLNRFSLPWRVERGCPTNARVRRDFSYEDEVVEGETRRRCLWRKCQVNAKSFTNVELILQQVFEVSVIVESVERFKDSKGLFKALPPKKPFSFALPFN